MTGCATSVYLPGVSNNYLINRGLRPPTKMKIEDRLKYPKDFHAVFRSLNADELECFMMRALRNLDAACKGNENANTAVLTSLNHIQRLIYQQAKIIYTEDV